jgi:PhzF family phenazine biosynthesis protein
MTTGDRAFQQVDVFASRVGDGNALAVVLDGDGIDAAAMQRFAAWTNLSESAFVLAPTTRDADARVRIFTPRQELPFAGHPTVGTVHALVHAGRIAREATSMKLECAAGVLPVRIERGGDVAVVTVRAPRAKLHAPIDDLAPLAAALGATPRSARVGDVGAVWTLADLGDAATVRTLAPDLDRIAALTLAHRTVGVAVFGRETGGDVALAVRAFCPADGIPEDPVTGSANAAIGAFLLDSGRLTGGGLAEIGARYVASQGRELGRDGRVTVDVDIESGDIWIGGTSVTCIEGVVRL